MTFRSLAYLLNSSELLKRVISPVSRKDVIMKTRLQELNEMLDDLDGQIMSNFPEGSNINNWLHNAIAKKVELEIERSKCMK